MDAYFREALRVSEPKAPKVQVNKCKELRRNFIIYVRYLVVVRFMVAIIFGIYGHVELALYTVDFILVLTSYCGL